MEQTDENDQDAGEQHMGGTWVALKDAAAHLGVSVDTVKRRMKSGELEARRETIPQGFRWLVRIDPLESLKNEAVESSLSDRSDDRGVQVPSDAPGAVAMLLRELEVRNELVAGQQETIATQARALAQNAETIASLEAKLEALRTSTDEAVGSSESVRADAEDVGQGDESTTQSGGVWARLVRLLRGE